MAGSSSVEVVRGNQVPTFSVVPAFVRSEVGDAAELASAYGLTPDPWQFTVLEGMLGVNEVGRWSAPRVGLTLPRQNGKNGVVEIVELFKMVVLGRKILHTAHEVKTCRKAFVRLSSFFDNRKKWPELADLVVEIRRTNGQEAIVLANGGSCEFIARSKASGRGFTVDDIVLDEAQEAQDEQMEALISTASSAPSGDQQLMMLGTPPTDGVRGEPFVRWRDLALAGGDGRLAWFEWSNDESADMSDPDVVANANPSLGIRLSWEFVEDERQSMSEVGFARERGGVWGGSSGSAVLDLDTWVGFTEASSKASGRVALAVDIPPEGRAASIAIAGDRADGRFHGEVDVKAGTTWVVDRLAEVARRRNAVVVLDAGGRAGRLIPDLVSRGVTVVSYGARDLVAAYSGFMDKFDEDLLRHHGQVELNLAVEGARRRRVGDAWAWHRRDTSVDVSPLVALSLALHGLKESPPKRRTGRSMAV